MVASSTRFRTDLDWTIDHQPHFHNFVVEVEQGYGSGKGAGVGNIYHNRQHAADVTQAVHYFLRVRS